MSKFWVVPEFKKLNENLDKLSDAIGQLKQVQNDDMVGKLENLKQTMERATELRKKKIK